MNGAYSLTTVRKFLSWAKCQKINDRNGREIWIMPDDVTIIQIPPMDTVPWEIFQSIAIEQMQIGDWEFDYWLGENC
jgi:hypothetical protein